jgi:hypothetical protein
VAECAKFKALALSGVFQNCSNLITPTPLLDLITLNSTTNFIMLAPLWSFLGWKKELPPSPPSVTVTGVRIPADGTPAHLVSLTTISALGAMDQFLFHIPDVRHYWNTDLAWECRDLHRLDLQQDHRIPQQHFLQQKHHLQQLLSTPHRFNSQQHTHLRQRYLLKQQYFVLPQHFSSCTGAYYMFFSFAGEYLPENLSLPAWVRDIGDFEDGTHRLYFGDIFFVKMAPHEHDENGWAAYEDIVPNFLNCLNEGPLTGN